MSSRSNHDSGSVFGVVFLIVWMGAAVVTINAKLLKSKV